ncbi:MAG TPA: FoF1 ATP synthase subunit epsilon [Acidimicrobiales bacterium]|nr:FoF1 ATP synthase subunit epsilon [Acidimicrobiales bacterium]
MADSSLFTVHLVTPERVLVSGLATEVILRTGDGDITFLAGHTPLVGTVEPGVVRVVRAEGEDDRVAVHGGFVQVEQGVEDEDGTATSGTRVTLLIGVAELAQEIDVDRARAALESAESRLSELGGAGSRTGAGAGPAGDAEEPDAELVEAQAELLRAQVRLETVDATSGATAGAAAG